MKAKGKATKRQLPKPTPTKLKIISLKQVHPILLVLKSKHAITNEDQASIKQQLQTNGVCVFGPFKDENWIQETIQEMKGHLEGMPRLDEYKIKLDKTTDLTPKEHLKQCWVPYVTFGAPSEPPAYHLTTSWNLRQEPALCDLFSELLDEEDLRVTIDRYKAKLPGTGDREFCHWDSNPWAWTFDSCSLQGIFAITDIEFVCVPKTHTEKFAERFKGKYEGLVKPGSLTMLDPDVWIRPQENLQLLSNYQGAYISQKDPLKLSTKEEIFRVPAGHFVLWDDKILHSSYPNKTKDIKFAIYISYAKATEAKQSTLVRVESFLSGKAPQIQPSGKIFTIMPAAWVRFPKRVSDYHKRLPEHLRETRDGAQEGQTFPIITEHAPENWDPPELTELGYKLLWGRARAPTQEDLRILKEDGEEGIEDEEMKEEEEIKEEIKDEDERKEPIKGAKKRRKDGERKEKKVKQEEKKLRWKDEHEDFSSEEHVKEEGARPVKLGHTKAKVAGNHGRQEQTTKPKSPTKKTYAPLEEFKPTTTNTDSKKRKRVVKEQSHVKKRKQGEK